MKRAISVYYFWGELNKVRKVIYPKSANKKKRMKQTAELGSVGNSSVLKSNLFWYHGDEITVPPLDIANRYANDLPFDVGMPGPSLTWSAFGDSTNNAIEYLRAGSVSPLILERMDESLVVLAHYLGWSLADVVAVKARKALSHHPSEDEWPQQTITTIENSLRKAGEYKFYQVANEFLSTKIVELKAASVDVDAEVKLLQRMRSRATEVRNITNSLAVFTHLFCFVCYFIYQICFETKQLNLYKTYLARYLETDKTNKLRDVEAEYVSAGYLFRLNGHMFFSFDLCGSCEAHAMLVSMRHNSELTPETAPRLVDMPAALRAASAPLLDRCPSS